MRQAARSRGPTGWRRAQLQHGHAVCGGGLGDPEASMASARARVAGAQFGGAGGAAVTVETVRIVPRGLPWRHRFCTSEGGGRWLTPRSRVRHGHESLASRAQVRHRDLVGDDEGADGRVGLETAGDARGDDQVLRGAGQGCRGEARRGGGGEAGPTPRASRSWARPVRVARELDPRRAGARTPAPPRPVRPGRRWLRGHVPRYGGRGQESFLRVKDHRPVTVGRPP